MDWRSKAVAQRILGAVPGGRHLNYLLQRHVTHTYPRRGPVLEEVISTAERHVAAAERFTGRPRGDLRFFEFGAGWDLATPLAMAALGVRSQHVVDIRPVARRSLVLGVVEDLRATGLDLPVPSGRSLTEVVESFGISYRAPADARATGLPADSVDVATSTSTLEHVDPTDIQAILHELRRILAPGAVCSFAIDYHDHYAGSDGSIGPLNFLRYSDSEWRRWNCPMQFQNRLRHGDYVELFARSGYEILEAEAIEDERAVGADVHERFRGRDDLRVCDGWFVLRPTSSGAVS